MLLSRKMKLPKLWKKNLRRFFLNIKIILFTYKMTCEFMLICTWCFIVFIGYVSLWVWNCSNTDCWYRSRWACEAGHEWNQCWYVILVELVCSVSAHNLFISKRRQLILSNMTNIFLFPHGIHSFLSFASSYSWVLDPKSNLLQKILIRITFCYFHYIMWSGCLH